jgi:hypothetical protein
MDETDAFFTQTIVGSPLTVLLGRRLDPTNAPTQGLAVGLSSGQSRLTRFWQDWVILSHACDPVGHPRMRPGKLRRFLERHALGIALLGLLALLGSAISWGLLQWS